MTLLDRSPAADDPSAPVDAPIEAEFSGAISTNGIASGFRLFLGTSSGAPVAAHYTFAEGARVASLTPDTPLALGADYLAKVEPGFPDAKGRPLAGFVWTFHTETPAATTLSRLVPAPGQLAPVNFVLRAGFSQPLSAATVSSLVRATIVTSAGGLTSQSLAQASYDAEANALFFRPAQDAPPNATIRVLVSASNLTDTYGRAIPSSLLAGWTFSTSAAGDYTRPVIGAISAATEAPAGSGSGRVTLPTVTDNLWGATEIRWEATFAHQTPPFPAGCDDVFDPQERRRAVLGSSGGGTLSVSGLTNGYWAVTVVAEDGSGRRSLPSAPKMFAVTAGAVVFDPVVKTIFHDRCAFEGCHAGPQPAGYIDLDTSTRDQVVGYQPKNPVRPVAVQPYCLSRSYLWWKLVPGYDIDAGLMPPSYVDTPALTRREREEIRSWIEQGAN